MVGLPFSTAGRASNTQDFSQKLAGAFIRGESVKIYTDFDGTLFPFCPNPDDVEIDPDCLKALQELKSFPNVHVVGLTGRDVLRAKEMVGDKVSIGIIGSHGVEYLKEGGTVVQYDFGGEVSAHIAGFKAEAAALKEKYASLGLVVELDKHGAVGVNAASVPEEERPAIIEAVFSRLLPFQTGHFKLVKEGPYEMELRPEGYGKDFGIVNFTTPDKDALTFFFCDSLGDHGTDRPAAELINDRSRFANGNVVMVLNGRNAEPSPETAYAPMAVFSSPSALGKALLTAIQSAKSQLTCHKTAERNMDV